MKQIGVIETVDLALARYAMLPPVDAPIVLMLSGGSDSVAAARIMLRLLPAGRFTVLHINHKLRGEDADEDERFVLALADELGLPCEVRRVDVAALAAASSDNVEQVGRRVRYSAAHELLDRLCLEAGVDPAHGRIITAHTLNDRVETFFMRVIVGGGAGALSSIPYRNGRVIRPFMDCERQQLRDWLVEFVEGGTVATSPSVSVPSPSVPLWREDASNYDTNLLRAFVRHELIPKAQSKNPELLRIVASSLNNLACDDLLLDSMVDKLEQQLVSYSGGTEKNEPLATIDGALFKEDQALVRRLIRRVSNKLLPSDKRITSEHIVTVAEGGNRIGFVTVIPGDVTVANEYGTLSFCRKSDSGDAAGDSWSARLEEGRPVILPGGHTIELRRVRAEIFGRDPVAYARAHASDTRVFVDEASLLDAGNELRLSRVQQGDRFCPLGMDGQHRLVSDVLIDRKIPRRLRLEMCKVSVGNSVEAGAQGGSPGKIVWVIGVQLDDRFKVCETTRSMLSIIAGKPEN